MNAESNTDVGVKDSCNNWYSPQGYLRQHQDPFSGVSLIGCFGAESLDLNTACFPSNAPPDAVCIYYY